MVYFYPYMEALPGSCKESFIVKTYDKFNRLFEDGNTVITVRTVNLGILTRLSNYVIATML